MNRAGSVTNVRTLTIGQHDLSRVEPRARRAAERSSNAGSIVHSVGIDSRFVGQIEHCGRLKVSGHEPLTVGL
jgi:hypothetical protein